MAPNPAKMRKSAEKAGNLLKLLSHPARLMIVCLLTEGETTVRALADKLNLRESTTSQHLARLKTAGVVKDRREAQAAYYRVCCPDTLKILQTLYSCYCK
jgi:ArsR family transcriptional regulator